MLNVFPSWRINLHNSIKWTKTLISSVISWAYFIPNTSNFVSLYLGFPIQWLLSLATSAFLSSCSLVFYSPPAAEDGGRGSGRQKEALSRKSTPPPAIKLRRSGAASDPVSVFRGDWTHASAKISRRKAQGKWKILFDFCSSLPPFACTQISVCPSGRICCLVLNH